MTGGNMDGEIYKVIIGFVAAMIGLLGFQWRIGQSNSQKFKNVHDKIEDVKEKYVRRDDVDKRFETLTKSIDKMDAKIDRLIERD